MSCIVYNFEIDRTGSFTSICEAGRNNGNSKISGHYGLASPDAPSELIKRKREGGTGGLDRTYQYSCLESLFSHSLNVVFSHLFAVYSDCP